VIFTGHETKLMQNATAAPIKRTALEKNVNLQIIFLFAVLIALCLISTVGQIIKNFAFGSTLGYLVLGNQNVVSTFFLDILTFWILYSNLVPISYPSYLTSMC
jgi:phospholipid-transporting ATPase